MAKRDSDEERQPEDRPDVLKGTTLRIYRFMFKAGRPLGVHEIQRGLGLSSPSVAHYHIRKLVSAGLVKEVEEGYAVDKVVFENIIRVRRSFIPFQTTYLIFFCTTLGVLLTVLRPESSFVSIYYFAMAINTAAIGIFAYETFKSVRKNQI